jgi:hypothetical protein
MVSATATTAAHHAVIAVMRRGARGAFLGVIFRHEHDAARNALHLLDSLHALQAAAVAILRQCMSIGFPRPFHRQQASPEQRHEQHHILRCRHALCYHLFHRSV